MLKMILNENHVAEWFRVCDVCKSEHYAGASRAQAEYRKPHWQHVEVEKVGYYQQQDICPVCTSNKELS